MSIKKAILFCAAVGLIVTACQPSGPSGSSKPTGNVKVGKPYVIAGKRYYPEYNPHYDKVGTASWYGPGFHGKYTANGEIYNQNDLTAAHPTLPMPSLVRVTNLHNGKSAIIRVNDRGPFKDNRIIDLSKKSAQRLGVKGLAKVRVKFLQRETQEYISTIKAGRDFDMFTYNDRPPSAKIVESTRYSSSDYGSSDSAAPVMTVQSSDTRPVYVQNAPPAPAAPSQDDYAMTEEDPTPDRTQSLAPAAGGTSGDYTIQAGVFSSKSNAQRLAEKLSDIASASLDSMESADKTLWRVRVGAFESHGDASMLLASVREQGNVPDAKVVRR